jgi:Cu2+-exporting ATPase
VLIDYDPFRLAESALLDEVRALTERLVGGSVGGPLTVTRPSRLPSPRTLPRLVGTTSVLLATCLPVAPPLAAGLLVASEIPLLLRAAKALGRRRVNGEVLEASTMLLLAAQGNPVAGALLGWLRAVGAHVVASSVRTTRRSLEGLVVPTEVPVWRVLGDERRSVPARVLRAGDIIAAGAGTTLPVDGTIVRGEALVDQQTMTGEALPVERRMGDAVFAATRVEHGEIEIRVERVGLETAAGRIVRAVELAAGEKSDIQVFAERLNDRGVARTLLLSALGAALARSVDAGLAILVADHGMAARVGIPTALLTAIRRAAAEGILVKGPRALEALARVDTVVFDKTGTLTTGSPRIARVLSYDRRWDEHGVIRLAAAAEREFSHPVARAVAALAERERIDVPETQARSGQVGLGVDVRVEGRRVLVGSGRYLEAEGVSSEPALADARAAHEAGASLTFVAVDGRLAGSLVVEDELREDAPAAVRALRARRMRNVIMLSGDHAEPTRVIADTLGVRHHYSELLPEHKARLIRELKADNRVVAMVGDGVNDALALREADVGIAVPGGTMLAAEAADVVLLSGGLDRVVRALDLAADGIAAVQTTLQVATHANLVVTGLASLGLAHPLTSIALSHGVTVASAVVGAAGAGRERAAPAVPPPPAPRPPRRRARRRR